MTSRSGYVVDLKPFKLREVVRTRHHFLLPPFTSFFNMSVLSRLARTIGYTYALQLGAAAVFVPLQTEVPTMLDRT